MAVLSTLTGGRARLRDLNVRSIIADLTRIYLTHRTRISQAVYLTLIITVVARAHNAIAEQKAAAARDAARRAERARSTTSAGAAGAEEEEEGKAKRKRMALNYEFFASLLRLLRIIIPSWRSREMQLLVSHSVFLVVRTLISLRVAAMDGAIVKSLVKGNGKEFLKRIVWWMLIAIPATFTNSMVSWAPEP